MARRFTIAEKVREQALAHCHVSTIGNWVIAIALASAVSAAHASSTAPTPSVNARLYGDGLTATAHGPDAVFHNPAGLFRYRQLSLRLASIDAMVDGASVRGANASGEARESESQIFERLFDRLTTEEETALMARVNPFEIIMPIFALQTFSAANFRTQRVDADGKPVKNREDATGWDLTGGMDTGAIAGLAVGYGPVSVGYSQYLLVRSGIRSRPTDANAVTIADASRAGTLDVDTVDFDEFTDFTWGSAIGRNIGVMVKPLGHQGLTVGVAHLMAGGLKFAKDVPASAKALARHEDSMQELAEEYGIELKRPESREATTNVGVAFAVGGTAKNFWRAGLNLETQDIGGEQVEHPHVVSGEVGLRVPWPAPKDSVFIRFALPQIGGGLTPCHLGLSSMLLIASHRPGESSTWGFDLSLHGGTGGVSYLTFELKGLAEEFVDGTSPTTRYGASVAAGLTLML